MRLFAAQLEPAGRADTVQVMPYNVVWWLAESADPRYAPVFLKVAADTTELARWFREIGFYGLARLAASDSIARTALRAMASDSSVNRHGFVRSLAFVNDTAVREILRRIPIRGEGRLSHDLQRLLRAPGLPVGRGHWPCSGDEVYGRTAQGGFGCIPDRAGAVGIRLEQYGGNVFVDTIRGTRIFISAFGPTFMGIPTKVDFDIHSERWNAPIWAEPLAARAWSDSAHALLKTNPAIGSSATLRGPGSSVLVLQRVSARGEAPWRLTIAGHTGNRPADAYGKDILMNDRELRRIIEGTRRAVSAAVNLAVQSGLDSEF
jgi:hypothetical protein